MNPKTDKEIIEQLLFVDNYEAAYLIASLKKKVAVLKRNITKLKKGEWVYKNNSRFLSDFLTSKYFYIKD